MNGTKEYFQLMEGKCLSRKDEDKVKGIVYIMEVYIMKLSDIKKWYWMLIGMAEGEELCEWELIKAKYWMGHDGPCIHFVLTVDSLYFTPAL